jgi:hypothetical protein
MDALEERLRAEGVEMRYRLDDAGARIGVSFLYQNEAFKGSEIDKRFSLQGLEKAVAQRQELSQWEAEKLEQGKEIRREEERGFQEQAIAREREALKLKEKVAEVPRQQYRPRLRMH